MIENFPATWPRLGAVCNSGTRKFCASCASDIGPIDHGTDFNKRSYRPVDPCPLYRPLYRLNRFEKDPERFSVFFTAPPSIFVQSNQRPTAYWALWVWTIS
jgi:hypothetical protein